MRRGPDIKQVAELLRDRIEDLAFELYPDGHANRIEFRHGRQGSVAIKLAGPDKGLWCDFEAGASGDPVDMLAHVLFAGDKRRAYAYACDWLGVGGRAADPRAVEDMRRRRERAQVESERQRQNSAGRAAAAWLRAQPELLGTDADRYLRSRGLRLDKLPKIPSAVRFEPAAPCIEDDPTWTRGCGRPLPTRPAIVAGLWALGDKTPRAVQRTFLAPGGDGKAKLREARKTLGSWPGALCPVSRGPTNRRVVDMAEGELVIVGEGLEEGLSLALMRPEARVFSCLYVGNFAQFRLPKRVRLMLAPNNDAADSAAAETFRRAVLAQREHGHVVSVIRPPSPHKDWNDYLQALLRIKEAPEP